MRKGLRRAGRWAAASTLLGLGAFSGITGSEALETEVVKYDPGTQPTYTYHADVVMAPTDGGTFTDPDTCATVTWCTMIPLEITPLQRDELDDWVVEMDISWDDSHVEAPDNVVGVKQQTNDLDTYLYAYGPLFDEEGNPEMAEDGKTQAEGYYSVGQSAGGTSPEIIKLFRPSLTKYFLVVTNFAGVNRGFDLSFTTTDSADSGSTPLFDDSPSSAPPSASSSSGRLSFGDTPTPKPFTPPSAASASAPPAAFSDDDFGFASEVPDDLLEADGPKRASLFAEEEVAPPADVAGSTLLVWLGLVPLLVVGGAAVFFVKRRPSTLSLRFPVRGAALAEPVAE